MKLSQLVYECIKSSSNLQTNNFTYEAFMDSTYSDKLDFSYQFANVFSALNLALSRLADSNKIPFKVDTDIEVKNKYVEFNKGKVFNIVILKNGDYERIGFRTLEQNKKYLLETNLNVSKVAVEYLPTLPHIFNWEDMKEKDADLEDTWGINDLMCSYIIEFVKGQIMEIYSPEIANLHNNRAEQYFADIKRAQTSFYQKKIKNVWSGFFL